MRLLRFFSSAHINQAILTKVGYLLSVVSAVVVFFVALRILGYDIGNLVLTWVRFINRHRVLCFAWCFSL